MEGGVEKGGKGGNKWEFFTGHSQNVQGHKATEGLWTASHFLKIRLMWAHSLWGGAPGVRQVRVSWMPGTWVPTGRFHKPEEAPSLPAPCSGGMWAWAINPGNTDKRLRALIVFSPEHTWGGAVTRLDHSPYCNDAKFLATQFQSSQTEAPALTEPQSLRWYHLSQQHRGMRAGGLRKEGLMWVN